MNLFENILFYVFIILFVSFISLYLYMWFLFGYWKRQGVDLVDEPSFPFGHFWRFIKATRSLNLQFFEFHKKIKGSFAGLYFFNQPALIVKDPDIIKRILVKDFNNFSDRGFHCNEEKEPLSGHLFRLNGDRWREMRSKLSPAFTIGKLKMMFETLAKSGQACEENLNNNSNVNITEHSLKFTADSIASIIFGVEVNSFTNEQNFFWKAVHTLLNEVTYKRYIFFTFTQLVPKIVNFLRIDTLFNKSNLQIFDIVKNVISFREKNKIYRKDFMQLMIQLKNSGKVNEDDNVGNTYDESYNSTDGLSIFKISASVYTMFFAGFDTSASTINYCLYQLALNPEVQQRVLEEIDRCINKHDGQITYESISEMHYLEMVIKETLRLYPVLGFISRQTRKDYCVPNSNIVIKKGTNIYVSLVGLHYDPDNFPDPEKFDPERFSSTNKIHIHSYTYMPFGDGPRNCIGKKLGMLMSMTGVVWFLRRHRVEACEKTEKNLKFHSYYLPHTSEKPIILKVIERNIKK